MKEVGISVLPGRRDEAGFNNLWLEGTTVGALKHGTQEVQDRRKEGCKAGSPSKYDV